MTDIIEQISQFLIKGDKEKVLELTQRALDREVSPGDILDNGLISGMNVVGQQFGDHEIFLPEVLLAARAMHAAMDRLKPLLLNQEIPVRGKIVIGTVRGDLHDIGKNLVGIMLKGAGFHVIDLGKDVPPELFVETAREEGARVIGMSALLTTTMPVMGTVTEMIRDRGMNDTIKTVIGGAPTSQEFARKIGADAHAYDAAKAVGCVKNLLGD